MDRNLALDLVRVTEAAALSAATHMGRGDKILADQAGVDGMRRMFDNIDIDGVVVIGEGEMDEAPMLYIGEQLGRRGPGAPQVDIAVDPVEGTTSVAKGLPNAIAVVAMAPRGCLLNAPDMYMDKIAVGPKAAGKVSLDAPVHENLKATAEALNKSITDLTVTILDRPRHEKLIQECRDAGARIKLFSDGDVAAALATCFDYTGVDILLGIGGAPEGVIAAAGIKCLGGQFEGRLVPANDEERARCIADWVGGRMPPVATLWYVVPVLVLIRSVFLALKDWAGAKAGLAVRRRVRGRLLERLGERYGSPIGFLKAHGLTDDEIVELRRVLVASA